MNMRIGWVVVILASAALTGLTQSVAAEKHADKDNVTVGEYRTLHSAILSEDRTVAVYAPHNYNDTDERYPVLYILGGISSERLMWAASTMEDLAERGKAPLMLIVQVDFVDGSRDSRPAPLEGRPNTGKADDFLRFLTEELRPFVDANYRTVSYNVLAGFSNTGLFSSYVCLAHTGAFDTYIAASPMISSAPEYMIQLMHDVFASGRTLNTRLYMNYGSDDFDQIVAMMPQVVALLEQEAPDNLHWTMERIDEGGHVPYLTMLHGLSFVFPDWCYPKDQLQTGGLTALQAFYSDLSARYGFPVKVPSGHLDDLGFAYLRAEQYDDAIDVLDYFSAQYPASALAQYLLGETHRRAGDTDRARTCFEKALELDPEFLAAKRRLEMLDAEG